jgi:hypothetical protein
MLKQQFQILQMKLGMNVILLEATPHSSLFLFIYNIHDVATQTKMGEFNVRSFKTGKVMSVKVKEILYCLL